MQFTILTLFPDYFFSPLQSSLLNKAQQKGLIACDMVNIRDFSDGPHHLTDDRPYGGGPGMVMLVEPIDRALQAVKTRFTQSHGDTDAHKRKVVLTSAKGVPFTQQKAREYAQLDELVIVCGHYEGVDERVASHLVDEEVCVGPYVLTGGEPAATILLDAVARLLPGVLGNEQSIVGESHDEPGTKGYPQYSSPREYKGWSVPSVLLSGNHAEIAAWRESMRAQE